MILFNAYFISKIRLKLNRYVKNIKYLNYLNLYKYIFSKKFFNLY